LVLNFFPSATSDLPGGLWEAGVVCLMMMGLVLALLSCCDDDVLSRGPHKEGRKMMMLLCGGFIDARKFFPG